jgi:transcription factor SFP1
MSMSYQPMAMSFGTSYNKSQVHSLMAARSDAELTKGYECCGQTHEGLHALLEHVEDHHGDGAGSGAGAAAASELNAGFSPQILAMDMELDGIDEELERETAASTRSSLSPPNMMVPNYPLPPSATKSDTSTGTSPAALHISDVLTSPPDADSNNFFASLNSARTASTCSSPPDGSLATPTTSTQPSPVFAPPKLNARGPSAFLGAASRPQPNRFDRAFNEVVAGKKDEVKVDDKIDVPTAVAPGVLFTTAVASLGIPTTPPVPGQKPSEAITENKANEGTDVSAVKPKPAEPPLPAPSLFTTHKPWRCPNPGCNKAYKQSNGLKYHQQKG